MRGKKSTGNARIVAAIDLGTLTCRLLIASVTPKGSMNELYVERAMLRVGEGVSSTHRLSESAINRVVDRLEKWQELLKEYQVEAVACVATSAVRDSDNRQELVERVKRQVGIEITILNGHEEATRSMLGIRSGLPPGVDHVLAMDIGGGSTELIVSRPHGPLLTLSIDMGVVRLTERFLTEEPPTLEIQRQVREWIRVCLEPHLPSLGPLSGLNFVGAAGTVTTLAAMAQGLTVYSRDKVQNYVLDKETIESLKQDLVRRSVVERRGMTGLEPGREDVILAGTCILCEVMDLLGFHTCLVSDLGLREGIILDLAGKLFSPTGEPTSLL